MALSLTKREGKYIAPPWIKFPTYPEESLFWKSGTGAEYLLKFEKNVENMEEYLELFPKAPTFTQGLEADDSLSKEAKEYLESQLRPLFFKLWRSDAKPKYELDLNKSKDSIFMYDNLLSDNSRHIHIGTKVYHSANEIIGLLEKDLTNISPELWEELKYTALLNAIYYKFVTDINFTKEVIKTGNRQIIFKSDNLEWGVQEEGDKYIGRNLLGLAVMELRDVLNPVYENYDDIDWQLSGNPYSEEHCSCGHVHTKNPYYH
ncbi:MAG: hypothetical protein BZ138_00295 [Methanosphaera sp. rholeuAM270]|nr:MAG: hypothetical protein BZ138_00295 [Methanosphaera sp. rholeuAM270]